MNIEIRVMNLVSHKIKPKWIIHHVFYRAIKEEIVNPESFLSALKDFFANFFAYPKDSNTIFTIFSKNYNVVFSL